MRIIRKPTDSSNKCISIQQLIFLPRLTVYIRQYNVYCILYNIDYSAAAQDMVDTDSGLSLVHLTVNVHLTIPMQT